MEEREEKRTPPLRRLQRKPDCVRLRAIRLSTARIGKLLFFLIVHTFSLFPSLVFASCGVKNAFVQQDGVKHRYSLFARETQCRLRGFAQTHSCKILHRERRKQRAGALVHVHTSHKTKLTYVNLQYSKYQKNKKGQTGPKQAVKEATKKAKRDKVRRVFRS